MKIAIDISQIIHETGVSVYTRELVRNLLEVDHKNEYVLFGGSLRQYGQLLRFAQLSEGNFRRKIYPFPPLAANLFFNYLRFPPLESLVGQVDIFHSSDWTQPRNKCKNVTTVHDLAPIRYPRETHPRIVAVHKKRLELVKKEVDLVIVPSEATKTDLASYGIKEEKIRVIPEAPSETKKRASETEIGEVKRKYKIDGGYLVTVGVGQRKNTQRLLEAFDKVSAGKNLKLVLIGRNSGFKEERGLRFTGHVSGPEFAALISGAEALVYPSLYEGFGLPVLEAFAAKTPVVTSNISSLPQVAGEGAVLVDPYEVDSIIAGIEEALKNSKQLIQKGSKRLRDFSWEATAKATLAVYNELC